MKITPSSRDHSKDFFWVVSYPKSGNTWVRFLLYYYILETLGIEPFETSDTTPYWYQSVSPKPVTDLGPFEAAILRPAAMMHIRNVFGDPSRPTVVKSHMVSGSYHGIPFFSDIWVEKAIYVHRDPRDVLPSLNDHMGHETLEDTVESMANTEAELGGSSKIVTIQSSWSAHVLSWIDNSRVDTLVTSYEKLHEDTQRELRRMVEHLGLTVDTEALEKAVEQSRFDKLQAEEKEKGFREKSDNQEKFFRKGRVGGWRDEVPEELVRQVEEDHREVMEMLGYLDG